MENGATLPEAIARFQRFPGFSFEDKGLGIYIGTVFDKVRIPNVNFGNGDIRVNGFTSAWLPREVSFYFPVSWGSQPQTQQQKVNNDFIWHLLDEKETVKRIKDIVSYAISKEECTKAFEAVGATPIKDQLKNVTIATQNVFAEPLYDSLWTKNSDVGKEMRAGFNARKTTKDVSYPGEYKETGWRFIGLTNSAVDSKASEHLSVVLIHSFIHSGGVPGEDIPKNWNGEKPHDLKNLGEKYKDILKHCTREGGSKELWGQ